MKKFDTPIYVTQPFLPPIEEFTKGLEEIWENKWLTNNGPVLKRFQTKLSTYFSNENICLFNNGTLALQIGLQGMGISGEVITTPFTFVATSHALYWNKIRPVFCDIEPDFFTIDPEKIERLITPWTTAILAVHVFGFSCQLEKLQKIATKHNLKLIYDSAHAFGVHVRGKPITDFGDLSMLSFHATKLFHSIEGGALVFKNNELKQTFDYLKNFGFKNENEVVMPGTNAKMNEFQALMGIQLLSYIDKMIEKRKRIEAVYKDRLQNVPGIKFCPSLPKDIKYNYSYMPVQIKEQEFGQSRNDLYEILKQYNVYTRKYFYPLLCDFACYQSITLGDPLIIARKIADNILTLPIYPSLKLDDVYKICEIIKSIKGA